MKNVVQIFLIAFLILFLFNITNKPSLTTIKYVNLGGIRVSVDLAVTTREKMLGLSGRQSLAEDKGLLFIFDESSEHAFWMKDMNFPIDIIWISSDLKIVSIKQDASPLYFPETYKSDQASQYVLEVVAGFSAKNNLKVGEKVEFTHTP
jgi:uncharacterized membrane protein (UPF0127 family)